MGTLHFLVVALLICINQSVSSGTTAKKCIVDNKLKTIFHCYTKGRKVCGSNGVTYGSICLLTAAQCQDTKIKLSHYGSCMKCGFKWGSDYNPVCATNGITYANVCRLRKAGCRDKSIRFLSRGHCTVVRYRPKKEREECSQRSAPLCGNNGVTYTNMCFFKKAQRVDKSLKIHNRGRCVRRDYACLRKYERCSAAGYSPVCGNNGVTYRNLCLLRRVQCEVRSINSYSPGRCVKEEDGCGGHRCSSVDNPVCGNNHVTYRNLCSWKKAQCGDKSLIFSRRGRCKTRLLIGNQTSY